MLIMQELILTIFDAVTDAKPISVVFENIAEESSIPRIGSESMHYNSLLI